MIITVIIAIFVFGIIIFVHELGHFLVAKKSGITVIEFAIGMGPILLKKEYKGTLYSLRALPLGGYTMMDGEETASDAEGSFSSKSLRVKLAVLIAGSGFNLILGYVILVILTAMGGYIGTTVIYNFKEDSVSHEYLQQGDEITKLNGHRVRTLNDITYEIIRDTDGLMDITLVRDGEIVNVPVQFEMEEIAEGLNVINLDFRVAIEKAELMDYVTYPFNWGMSIIKQVYGSLVDLITGRVEVNQLSGPIGIVDAIGKASQMGVENVLLMTAFIAINLGVFNLLPLPILDGGKILLFTIEKIIGRPIGERAMNFLILGSVAFILALSLYATFNDVIRML